MATIERARRPIVAVLSCAALTMISCQRSSSTAPDASAAKAPAPAATADPTVDAWGARMHVPPSFQAEQNQAGGYELTDGKLVILLGRHDLEATRSLSTFFDERRATLASFGRVDLSAPKPEKLAHGAGLSAEGRAGSEGGDVGLKLFVARVDAHTGLSALLIHNLADKGRAKTAWRRFLGRSRLPETGP